jgi:hypothetical protein
MSREGSQVEANEIRARFDGRARVELPPRNLTAAQWRQADETAHALGYRPLAAEQLWPHGVRLVYA